MDDNGLGTHVAGTVAGVDTQQASQVQQVAPKVELYAIKVLDRNGSGSYSDVISGIEWPISNNIDIVNMSFGGSQGSRTLQNAVDKCLQPRIVIVAAAGNNGYDRKGIIGYPAKYAQLLLYTSYNGTSMDLLMQQQELHWYGRRNQK